MNWDWLYLVFLLGGVGIGLLLYQILKKLLKWHWIRKIEEKQLHFSSSDRITREYERLPMDDGKEVQVYIYTSEITPKENAPTLLFLHGLGGYAQDFNAEPILSTMALSGYKVFAYDYRGSGKSLDDNTPPIMEAISPEFVQNLVDDPKTVLDWVYSQPGIDQDRILVIGTSLGGALALSSLIHDERVKLIIGICTPYSFTDIYEKKLVNGSFFMRIMLKMFKRKLKNVNFNELIEKFKSIEPANMVKQDYDYSNRVFVAHCKDDQIVPFEICFERMIKDMKLPEDNYIVFERGGHEFKGNIPAVLGRIMSWVNKKM